MTEFVPCAHCTGETAQRCQEIRGILSPLEPALDPDSLNLMSRIGDLREDALRVAMHIGAEALESIGCVYFQSAKK